MSLAYRRILLKLSGEALAGDKKTGLDYNTVTTICQSIKKAHDLGMEIAIVVGGGNFWRGRSSGEMERTRADHIGMLATVMNALALADSLEQLGCDVRVQTAITMTPGETYGTIEIGADKSVSITIAKNTGNDWVKEVKTGTHANNFEGTVNHYLFGYNYNNGTITVNNGTSGTESRCVRDVLPQNLPK